MIFEKKHSEEPAIKANPLKIIIVGAGKVGSTLVEQLSREGNDITVIDKNREKIAELTNQFDVMGMVGNGASFSLLNDAGIKDADLFIAVTRSDELNLLCCTIAKQSSDVSTIARVRMPEYSNEIGYLREKLGLAMIINPELETARETSRILYMPTALEVNSFAHGQAELIKIRIKDNSPLNGMSLTTFGSNKKENVLICAIERGGEVIIPYGDSVMQAGDNVSFVAPPKTARKFLQRIGLYNQSVHNCMIIGGGRAAFYLANLLIHMGIQVKIIEKDPSRCDELTTLLPEAIIINGDGTDSNLLLEEGIQSAEGFVALTGIDEENIMLTMHAKHVSQAKVVTKINRYTFSDVISSLDLGSVLYPRYITSDAIIGYVRAKRATGDSNIETLYHMFDNRAEAIEFHVDADSKVTDTPIRDLNLKRNLVVCFIMHRGHLILPTGDDMIHVGDTVMVLTTETGFTDIKDILA